MNDTGEKRLDLLLFSVGGVHFGVDAGQVAGIEAYDCSQADGLLWFHKELDYGDGAVTYFSPTVITIRTDDGTPYQVIIDRMEEIAEYDQNDIRLLPELIEPLAIRNGLWGVMIRNGRMVLLIDFLLLLRERPDA